MPDNIFTVDVEEYYHAENIADFLSGKSIENPSDRLNIGMRKLINLLTKNNNKATFFVLASLAEKNKNLLRELVSLGHEIASHGYNHIPLNKHTPESFEKDLDKSLEILGGITGEKIIGFRAMNFSLPSQSSWFSGILKKKGISYDSSFSYSFFRACYDKDVSSAQYCRIGNEILEFPVSFLNLGMLKMPLGGGYFRACPYWMTKIGLERAGKISKMPAVFYIHPWELDPGQPKFRIQAVKRFRHYYNLDNTENKIERLFKESEFTSIKQYLAKNNAGNNHG